MISYKQWYIYLASGILSLYMSLAAGDVLIAMWIDHSTDANDLKMMGFLTILLLIVGIISLYLGIRYKIFCKKFKYRPGYKYIDANDGGEVNFLWCLERFGPGRMKNIEYDDEKKIGKITFDW